MIEGMATRMRMMMMGMMMIVKERANDIDDLYDKEFNPHCLAHGNSKAKEGLSFLLPGIIKMITACVISLLSSVRNSTRGRLLFYSAQCHSVATSTH